MSKYILFSLVTVLALFLQRIWVEYVPLFGTGPDLTLLILIYFAAFHDPVKGLVVAFLLGFSNDILFGYHPGLYVTIYVILFASMYLLGKSFYLRSVLFQLSIAAIVMLAFGVLEFVLLSFLSVALEIRIALWWSLPWRMLLNVLVAPVVFRILWAIEDLSTPSLLRTGRGFGSS